MRLARFAYVGILLIVLSVAAALAQQTPPPPPPAAESKSEAPVNEGRERVLGIIPAFGITNRRDAPPLTSGQKFTLFAREAVDPVTFAGAGLSAAIGQARNDDREYGQGAAGYGKRFGVAYLGETSNSFFSNFAYPVLFRQDPRYFRLGTGPVKRRIGYALTREFVTTSDAADRHRVFNWSSVLGAFSAAALANAYLPTRNQGWGPTMTRSASSIGFGSASGLVAEFWPDIRRKFFTRKKKAAAPAAPAPAGS